MSAKPSTIRLRYPEFTQPYTDVDEWRERPVRHRYVHGGFEGTELRFSYYFPPEEQYDGRFFQPILAVSGTEHLLSGGFMASYSSTIDFGAAHGAYMVESNLGLLTPYPKGDSTLTGFRGSAVAAEYSRVLAAEMYGEHRPFGYCFGGSGGGYKTISCLESTMGVWDGGVPFVHGDDATLPSVFGAQAYAMRILRGKLAQIIDSIDPGSGQSMYDGLDAEERAVLAEVTRLGCPPRTWFAFESSGAGAWPMLADNVVSWDPDYFANFWTEPGYLGFNPPPSLREARLQHKTTVKKVYTNKDTAELEKLGVSAVIGIFRAGGGDDLPVAFQVAHAPNTDAALGAALKVKSGKCAGRQMWISGIVGDVVITFAGGENFGNRLFGIAAGDEVVIDNSDYLAVQTYHRHQILPGYPEWDQFVVDGEPVYPQRRSIGPRFARYGAGSTQSGRFDCKMIVVQNLMDEFAWPNLALHYRKKVEAVMGSNMHAQYRLWFTDHATHGSPEGNLRAGIASGERRGPALNTRIVSFQGVIEQALLDVSAWVERGIAPPASTTFEWVDGQVHVPAKARERRGIQPTVELVVDGGERAEVRVGQLVKFRAIVEVPPGAGTIVSAEWDFDGLGQYSDREAGLDGSAIQLTLTESHTYTKPGTYFPALRVGSHRRGNTGSSHARIENLGRVRVVVS
jgi:hypothetical protein